MKSCHWTNGYQGMDLQVIILSDVSHKEKDKHHDITCMWNLKYDTNELIYNTERQTQRTDLLPRGRVGRGGKDWESGISRYKLLCMGWINKKVLLCNEGNYIQYPVINRNGKENKKKQNMCITESLCCTAEKNILNQRTILQ